MFFKKKNDKIKNIKYIRYTGSTGTAINASFDYSVELIGNEYIAKVRLNGKSNDETKEMVVSDEIIKNIENILNEYRVIKWNRFNKYDQNVLDGNSFGFNIKYDGNKSINASGYMKWPDNYGKVRVELEKIFTNLYNNN